MPDWILSTIWVSATLIGDFLASDFLGGFQWVKVRLISDRQRHGRSLEMIQPSPRICGNGYHTESASRDRLGIRHVGATVKQFRYLRDELFLTAATCYGLNRWLIKPWVTSPFLHGQFNDLLLIPTGLPVVLWIQRKANLRTGDVAPTWSEITLHLLVWSVICEFMGPVWLHRGTADPWDVAAYAAGGVVAGIWWNYRPQSKPKNVS
jgi:hypothetical protein